MTYEDRQARGGLCIFVVLVAAIVLLWFDIPLGCLGAACFILGCKLGYWVEANR